MTFTDLKIRNLKPKNQKRYVEWEHNGYAEGTLGIRVGTSGKKSWVYRYHFNGKNRLITLGSYPDVSLAEARKLFAEATSLREQHIDPETNFRPKPLKTRVEDSPEISVATMESVKTVNDLCSYYITMHAKKNKKSWKEDIRLLDKHVIPVLGKRLARDIARREVINMLDGIVNAGSPVQANRVLAVTRKMFNFAVEREILDTSPCVMVKKPTKEKPVKRALHDHELETWLKELPNGHCTPLVQRALLLILLTGQRPSEVGSMETSEIEKFDADASWWNIPGHKTKNGEPHRVWLTSTAMKLVKEARKSSSHKTFVFFPGTKRHLDRCAMSHAVRRSLGGSEIRYRFKNKKRYPSQKQWEQMWHLEKFTPHDLRRTAATQMGKLKVDDGVIDRGILNHIDKGVKWVYNRHAYEDERKEALELLSSEVLRLAGGKIVLM